MAKLKEILIKAGIWFVALALLYIVFLKAKILLHF